MPSLDTKQTTRALALKAEHPDWGYIRIGNEIGWHKDKVRRAIEHAERKRAIVPLKQGNLGWYETARQALAKAVAIDEVKSIRDKAAALQIYAKQAKDRELIDRSTEIKLRAEIRSGEILKELALNGARPIAGRPKPSHVATLADLDISRTQSSRWQQLAALPQAEQEAKIAKAKRIAVATIDGDKTVLNEAKAEKQAEKRERRATRERILGGIQQALPTKKFGIIVADPEWKYQVWDTETGLDRSAANHYPVSELEIIMARDVWSIAADDCILFLWVPVPHLPEAFCVLDAWGFGRMNRDEKTGHLTYDRSTSQYVTSGAWVKYHPGGGIGMGHWFRVDHEILLVATRGKPPAPAEADRPRSVFDIPASAVHSQKPELILEMIEKLWPTLPKIELNRRGPPRLGWDAWGLEAEAAE